MNDLKLFPGKLIQKAITQTQYLKLPLSWKHNLLAGHDLGDVEIEEVAVEHNLDHAGHDGDDVIEGLLIVAEDPVEDVGAAIGSKGEQIVAGDRLGLPGLGDHEQLGQDGDTLQVDGEGPQDLHHTELVVEDKGQESGGSQEKLDPERVVVAVIRRLELEVHEVHCGGGAGDEKDLHAGVIDADEVGHQVQVPGHKHDQEEDLTLAGDTGAAPSLPDLEEQGQDGEQVRQVTQEPENVHPEIVTFNCL